MSIREDIIKDKRKFWEQRKKELEDRRLKKQSADDAVEEVITRKDLKKMAKKAKAKSRITQGLRNEKGASDGFAAAPASKLGSPDDGEREEGGSDENDDFLHGATVDRQKTELSPGEWRIIHQGKVDLSELFGHHSTLPMEKPVPENLRVEIHLGASVLSSTDIDVAISENNKVLTIARKGDPYAPHTVPLPHAVDFAQGRAQFFCESHRLHLVLPVLKSGLLGSANSLKDCKVDTGSAEDAQPPLERREPLETAEPIRQDENKSIGQDHVLGKRSAVEAGQADALAAAKEDAGAGEFVASGSSAAFEWNGEDPKEDQLDGSDARLPPLLERQNSQDSAEKRRHDPKRVTTPLKLSRTPGEVLARGEAAASQAVPIRFAGEEATAASRDLSAARVSLGSLERGETRPAPRDGGFLEVTEPEFHHIARSVSSESSAEPEQETSKTSEASLDSPPDATNSGIAEIIVHTGNAASLRHDACKEKRCDTETHAPSPEKLEFASPFLIREEKPEVDDGADADDFLHHPFVECVDDSTVLSDSEARGEGKKQSLPGPSCEARGEQASREHPLNEGTQQAGEPHELEAPEIVETKQNLLLLFSLPAAFAPFEHQDNTVQVTDSRTVSSVSSFFERNQVSNGLDALLGTLRPRQLRPQPSLRLATKPRAL
nr:TPA: hypothetical protein BN1204_065490 [Neospora caninum Liverpool]